MKNLLFQIKILIETNQLVMDSVDTQIVKRSLPKLKYYAATIPLIIQRSVLNTDDEIWRSLCYDWSLKTDWVSTEKNNIYFGNGWYPFCFERFSSHFP